MRHTAGQLSDPRLLRMGYILTPLRKNMTTTETAVPELQLPPRYQVRAVLKETPATAVYRVFDVPDNRDEAIKILRHELSEPQQLLRFRTEFQTLASLEHPSIIRVFDYGLMHDRFPY